VKPITFSTPIVLRTLPNNQVLAIPVASPKHVSLGNEESALAEQRLFWNEYLKTLYAQSIARFLLPNEAELKMIDVVVPHKRLPRSLAITTNIDIASLLLPAVSPRSGKKDTWVFLLPLQHTFFVPDGEDIRDAIMTETVRIVTAYELSAWEYLRILPGGKNELHWIPVTLDPTDGAGSTGAKQKQKQLVKLEQQRLADKTLLSVAIAMHTQDDIRHAPPHLDRHQEEQLLSALLSGKDRISITLIGASGTGKSALVRNWLGQQLQANNPRLLYATSGARLIAGMSGLGQWQERLRRVLNAAELLDGILYFDNFYDLFTENASSYVDFISFIKPYIEDRRVRIVGELTPEQADWAERQHPGFFSLLHSIRLQPFSALQSLPILKAHVKYFATNQPHLPQIHEQTIAPLLELAERYLPYHAFPGKAVRLVEELRAAHRGTSNPSEDQRIGVRQVFEWFSLRTGIPTNLLREDQKLKLVELTEFFGKRLVGQQEAIRRVAETICVIKAGLQPEGKPLATFLFVGPTGVGKTELARALSEYLFGTTERMIRFDMSEYTDPWAADRLIRGTENSEGQLTQRIRQQPFSVLLLDEIEKAHPIVFDLLLQVCGEGRLTDGKGRTAYFNNTIVILTSNLGASHKATKLGFGDRSEMNTSRYTEAVHRQFRPEFINRLDRIVIFDSLTLEESCQVTRYLVRKIVQRRGLLQANIELKLTEAALNYFGTSGMNPAYGARGLRRYLDEQLTTPLANLLGTHEHVRNSVLQVALIENDPEAAKHTKQSINGQIVQGPLVFTLLRSTGNSTQRNQAEHAMNQLSDIRREIQKFLALNSIAELRERLEFLAVQLNSSGKQKQENAGYFDIDRAKMRAEHHRIEHVISTLDEHYQGVCIAEDLALEAFFQMNDFEDVDKEARHSYQQLRSILLQGLCLQDKNPDSICLLIQNSSDDNTIKLWLRGFFELAEKRNWLVNYHLHAIPRTSREEHWPLECRWSAALNEAELREHAEKNDIKQIIICVSGEWCGSLLALEAGLHQWHLSEDKQHPTRQFRIQVLSEKSKLNELHWLSPTLTNLTLPQSSEFKAALLVRNVMQQDQLLLMCGKQTQLHQLNFRDYWERIDDIALQHRLLMENDPDFDTTAMEPLFSGGMDEVKEWLKKGQKISAIKAYRDFTGCSLKDAKDAVESIELLCNLRFLFTRKNKVPIWYGPP
jgi:ATP-dependent Clp protease ATP-binding subunit ClpC